MRLRRPRPAAGCSGSPDWTPRSEWWTRPVRSPPSLWRRQIAICRTGWTPCSSRWESTNSTFIATDGPTPPRRKTPRTSGSGSPAATHELTFQGSDPLLVTARTLTQLVRVLLRCGHRRCSSQFSMSPSNPVRDNPCVGGKALARHRSQPARPVWRQSTRPLPRPWPRQTNPLSEQP
jgi:hypothetical protein